MKGKNKVSQLSCLIQKDEATVFQLVRLMQQRQTTARADASDTDGPWMMQVVDRGLWVDLFSGTFIGTAQLEKNFFFSLIAS